MTGKRKRVAVVGAAGIGKHHANWWHIEGAEVCAVAGTSAESVAKAEAGLRALFPYNGRGYTSLATLLERERPDIVDICSPPGLHYEHTREALQSGCDVLCEKPFVYRPGASSEDLLREANELIALSRKKRSRLGLCVQYLLGARLFADMWRARFPEKPIESFWMHLEVPARGRPADPERIWADLAPHPLSAVQALCLDGELNADSIEVEAGDYKVSAQFEVGNPGCNSVKCAITVSNSLDPPGYVREMRLNGYPFCVEGATDDKGVYCTRIRTPDSVIRVPDLMRSTLRAFLDNCPTAGPEAALVNTEWLLRISELGGVRR
ncbi:MAG: Gfo/Idh/MocA family oxidoreductase [FCB group bacterium]|jgi:hypothetical protein|nr:Gfo/Idh/MocA family oxidoreductase [FCB group bacterium]